MTLAVEDLVRLRLLVDRYADAVDRRDAGVLRTLFTAGGILTMQADGGPVESQWSGEQVTDLLGTLSDYRTLHHIGGAVFDGDGRSATGRVQCLAHHYQRTASGPVDLVMAIRYHDRYECDGAGGWRIAERRVAVEWTELHPAHPRRRA